MTSEEIIKLKEVTGLDELPDWTFEKVKYFHEIKDAYFYQFLDEEEFFDVYVDLKRVTGSTYFGAYNGFKWGEMRIYLKRRNVTTPEQALREALNPTQGDWDKIRFLKFGQDYLIHNGHHRTCILKFAKFNQIPATVIEYKIDNELLSYYNILKKEFEIDLDFDENLEPHKISHLNWELRKEGISIVFFSKSSIKSFMD